MNILVLYNETQTFTPTVYEHLDSFARFSQARVFFGHQDLWRNASTDLHLFDAVIVHFSIRLPFDQISEPTAQALTAYAGLKIVFIQDEYDHTQRAWHWIRRLGIRLVFSSVPAESMSRVYPPAEFPGVQFVSNLTGYAPEALAAIGRQIPPSQRPLKIGYRGRALPIRYGVMGQDKVEIGRMVKAFCEKEGIEHDIAWKEKDRLYGDVWYQFNASCRAMLGIESGSNVFDWDGSLPGRIAGYRKAHPRASDQDVYLEVIAPLEMPGLMNQVSARIFEAIACRTALVLFEGNYSGVLIPDRHFIPLRRDGSNLREMAERLRDGAAVDTMTTLAYDEVLANGKYSYPAFIGMVDHEIQRALERMTPVTRPDIPSVSAAFVPMIIRTRPHRYQLVRWPFFVRMAGRLAPYLPRSLKSSIKRALGIRPTT